MIKYWCAEKQNSSCAISYLQNEMKKKKNTPCEKLTKEMKKKRKKINCLERNFGCVQLFITFNSSTLLITMRFCSILISLTYFLISTIQTHSCISCSCIFETIIELYSSKCPFHLANQRNRYQIIVCRKNEIIHFSQSSNNPFTDIGVLTNILLFFIGTKCGHQIMLSIDTACKFFFLVFFHFY